MAQQITADENVAELAQNTVEDTLAVWGELVDRDLAEKHYGDRHVLGEFHHEDTAVVDMHPVLGALNALAVGDDPGRIPSAQAVEALADDLAEMNQIAGTSLGPVQAARSLAEALRSMAENEGDEATDEDVRNAVEQAEGEQVVMCDGGQVQAVTHDDVEQALDAVLPLYGTYAMLERDLATVAEGRSDYGHIEVRAEASLDLAQEFAAALTEELPGSAYIEVGGMGVFTVVA